MQSITIKFEIYDEVEEGFDKLPVNERAENIAQFVADELTLAGSVVEYEILESEEE